MWSVEPLAPPEFKPLEARAATPLLVLLPLVSSQLPLLKILASWSLRPPRFLPKGSRRGRFSTRDAAPEEAMPRPTGARVRPQTAARGSGAT